MLAAQASILNLWGSDLRLLKSTINAENFILQVDLVHLVTSQFSRKMCAAAKNWNKITKNPYFGESSSFKVIDVDKSKKPVTSACYDNQHVCTYLRPFLHQTS